MFQNSRRLVAVAIVLLTAGPFAASAQQPVTGPAANNCENPGENPPDRKSATMTKFNKQVEEYKACINVYAKDNGAKAAELSTQAKAYMAAANKAIEDYNQYVATVNANNDKANADAAKK